LRLKWPSNLRELLLPQQSLINHPRNLLLKPPLPSLRITPIPTLSNLLKILPNLSLGCGIVETQQRKDVGWLEEKQEGLESFNEVFGEAGG
jgi:hypothetical protein